MSFCCWFVRVLYKIWILDPDYMIWKYFLPFCGLSFHSLDIGIPCFMLFCFINKVQIALCRYSKVFFRPWRFVATLLSKSIEVIFSTEFAYFVLLCNILVTLKLFQTFEVLLYVLQWSVIFDVTIIIVWGYHEPYLNKMASFIDKCCVCSDCSNNQLFPTSPSTQAYFLRTTILKLGQLILNGP